MPRPRSAALEEIELVLGPAEPDDPTSLPGRPGRIPERARPGLVRRRRSIEARGGGMGLLVVLGLPAERPGLPVALAVRERLGEVA